MLDYIDPAMDDGDDVDGFEVAVALLTNPTNAAEFALNVEARTIVRSADDSDEHGLFFEALAVIP